MTNEPADRRDPTDPIRPRRPLLLTLVLWAFVLWTALGWLRFYGALTRRMLILEVLPGWIFWYLMIAGLIWGLLGLPVIWGVVFRAGWVQKMILIVAVLYPLIYWVERLLIWRSTAAQSNWPFMLLLTGLWFGVIIWILRSGKVRHYFKPFTKED